MRDQRLRLHDGCEGGILGPAWEEDLGHRSYQAHNDIRMAGRCLLYSSGRRWERAFWRFRRRGEEYRHEGVHGGHWAAARVCRRIHGHDGVLLLGDAAGYGLPCREDGLADLDNASRAGYDCGE